MNKQPNLFLIGGMRCGSTSLHWMLGQHPDVYMSPVKEPMYYVAEDRRRRLAGNPNANAGDLEALERFVAAGKYRSTDAYQTLFAEARGERYLGESSHYLYHGSVAETIRSDCPEARIVVSLRNPVERVFSEYQLYRRRSRAKGSFEDFLNLQESFDDDGSFTGMGRSKITKGFYVTFLQEWVRTFGLDRIRIILFENFTSRPVEEIRRVYSWLGIDAGFSPKNVHAQIGGEPIGSVYGKLVKGPALAPVRKRVPKIARQRIGALVSRLLLREATIQPEMRRLLEDIYRDEADILMRDFHLDLSPWAWV